MKLSSVFKNLIEITFYFNKLRLNKIKRDTSKEQGKNEKVRTTNVDFIGTKSLFNRMLHKWRFRFG